MGAQRLSASTNSTLAIPPPEVGDFMCSTPVGINEFNASKIFARCSRSQLCSTPVGINEFNAAAQRTLHPLDSSVLNACRHQRIQRPQAIRASFEVDECSTPVGINEFNAWY